MVSIKLAKICSPAFTVSFQKLIKSTVIPVKTAFKLKKLAKRIEEERDNYDTLRREIAFKYAQKDESGNPIIEEGSVRIPEASIPACDKEMNDLSNITIDVEELVYEDTMPKVELTVEDLLILEFVVSSDELEELEFEA